MNLLNLDVRGFDQNITGCDLNIIYFSWIPAGLIQNNTRFVHTQKGFFQFESGMTGFVLPMSDLVLKTGFGLSLNITFLRLSRCPMWYFSFSPILLNLWSIWIYLSLPQQELAIIHLPLAHLPRSKMAHLPGKWHICRVIFDTFALKNGTFALVKKGTIA